MDGRSVIHAGITFLSGARLKPILFHSCISIFTIGRKGYQDNSESAERIIRFENCKRPLWRHVRGRDREKRT